MPVDRLLFDHDPGGPRYGLPLTGGCRDPRPARWR